MQLSPIYIIMGVSGSGKTTVGELLARRLQLAFHDADEFHSPANIDKMARGIPLTDADRAGWLRDMATGLREWETSGGAVLACSALKEKYRATLQGGARRPLRWVYLDGSRALLHERLENRQDHYMKASMLDSQLDALEEPAYGLHLALAGKSPEDLVREITSASEQEEVDPAVARQ